ncbi:DUF6779 domain-containing protein [Nocardia sp. NPDC051030]|uniref:DUF6779 domain-containing protein n=1 Tax=Nocardia sp. NPDC051030 TaxID=3155162 RepID=UPI0034301AFD
MVSPSRSSASRRQRGDAGRFFTGVLLLLGLVASIFLVFSDNVHMIRVGLVAALWAAAIGALAATRFRREAAVDKAKVGDLQKVYHLQLEREVAARREYELGVEARVRSEVGADAEEMAALRTELTVLRESLQRLFDGDLPFERPALRADAVRVQELPSRAPASNPEPANSNWDDAEPWDPWSTPDALDDEPDARSRITPVFEPDHPEPPAFATPFDDPVTAETSVVTETMRLDYERAEALKAQGRNPKSEAPKPTPSAAAPAAKTTDTKRTEPIGIDREKLEQVPWFETDLAAAGNVPAPAASTLTNLGEAKGSADKATGNVSKSNGNAPMGTASARRRRRSDEDAGNAPRLSVAEIMANLKSESEH